MTDWDGIERREAAILAEHLATATAKQSVEAPIVIVLVGFAAVLLLQVASLWGHGVIAGAARHEDEKQEEFRRQIACFIIKASQGKQGPDLLTDCGFLTLGAK